MESLCSIKSAYEDFEVEIDILPAVDINKPLDARKKEIYEEMDEIDYLLDERQKKIDELNKDIDRLTNHADGLDYSIAVASGILTGLIDIFVVGEWDFTEAKKISNIEANEKVMKLAQKHGYTGGRLKGSSGAIKSLEDEFKLPGDNTWNIANQQGADTGISAISHHLDDFCHHPTLIGLISCILVQFTKGTIYSNKDGKLIRLPISVDENGKLEGKTPEFKISAGVINWCLNVARNRKGHLISDIAGSNTSIKDGAGIPGVIISTLKELSALPVIQDSDFPKKLSKAYQNGIGDGKNQVDLGVFNRLFEGPSSKMDIRTENAIKHELKRQAMPVVLNEVIVRSFYFVRRFINELKIKKDIFKMDWKAALPFRNRTIARMMTIATGTFTAVDLAGASIESLIKSGGPTPAFLSNMIVNVNFVGIGRFAIAAGTDVAMGVKRSNLRDKRIEIYGEMLYLSNAKVYYKQADMWIAAESAEKTIEEAYDLMEETTVIFIEAWKENKEALSNIGKYSNGIKKNNESLLNDINDILKWG